MDDATKMKVKQAIEGNVHLFSARHNRDYLTMGIEIAPKFPSLTKRVDLVDANGNPGFAMMVPIDVVKDAMTFTPKALHEVAAKAKPAKAKSRR